MLGSARSCSDPFEIVAEIGGSSGHRTSRQQFVHDLGGRLDSGGSRNGVATESISEIEAVDDRFDDSARDELVQAHQGLVTTTAGVGRRGARLFDRFAESLMQDAGHIGWGLPIDHCVGIVVDNGRHL